VVSQCGLTRILEVRIKDLKGQDTDSIFIPKEQTPFLPDIVSEGDTVTPVAIGVDSVELTLKVADGAKELAYPKIALMIVRLI